MAHQCFDRAQQHGLRSCEAEKGVNMGRTNLDPITMFPEGSHLFALYIVTVAADDQGAFRVVANHLVAATWLMA